MAIVSLVQYSLPVFFYLVKHVTKRMQEPGASSPERQCEAVRRLISDASRDGVKYLRFTISKEGWAQFEATEPRSKIKFKASAGGGGNQEVEVWFND